MSLEHALLDRLEKRSLQIAQQKNEIYGLRQLVNEKMAINEQLAEQITTARLEREQITTARLEREQMQHQIAELRTERDRIREISKSLVPKSALMQAVQEAAELHAEVSKLVEENKKLVAQTEDSEVTERRERLIKSLNDEITKRDHELRAHEKELAEQREEIRKLRAEVPLESTREGLKNAVAKLQEVTTDRDRVLNELAAILAEANKSGRCGGDPVALLKQGQTDLDTAQSLERQIGGLTTEMKSLANQLMDAKAEASGIRVHVNSWGCKEGETVTAFIQRLSMELAEAKTDLADTIAKTTDLGSYAMTLGRKEGEPLEMFMERQALRLAALETTIAAAKCDELAKATARIKPLEALYKTLKGWQENDHIIGYGLTIDTAINKATEALSQLTA